MGVLVSIHLLLVGLPAWWARSLLIGLGVSLAAHFRCGSATDGFILGDGLITNPIRESLKADQMPGHMDMKGFQADDGSYIFGFAPKLNIFNQRVAIAWSGDLTHAESLCDVVYEHVVKHSRDVNQLPTLLTQYTEYVQSQLGGDLKVICVSARDGGYDIWHNGVQVFEKYNNVRKILVIGSGTKAFLDCAAKFANLPSVDQSQDLLDANALCNALTLVMPLYFDDLFFQQNYRERFGGIHELAWIKRGRISKIRDMLFLNVLVDCDRIGADNYAYEILPYFLKYDVLEDVSVLREFRLTQADDGRFTPTLFPHFMLPLSSEQRTMGSETISKVLEGNLFNSELLGGFDSRVCCVFLVIEDDHNFLMSPKIWIHLDKRQYPVKFRFESDTLQIHESAEMKDSIRKTIDRYVDRDTRCIRTDVDESDRLKPRSTPSERE